MPNFKIKCGVRGCPLEYTKMDSFRKHLRRHHIHDFNVAEPPLDIELDVQTLIMEDLPLPELSTSSESSDDESDHSVCTVR